MSCNRKEKFSENYQGWKGSKQHGYNRNLFRNKRDGKISGVCAGLADHLCIDHWIVRILFIALFFMVGPVIIWAYVAGIILLAKRPQEFEPSVEYDEDRKRYREKTIFKHSKPAPERLRLAREKMDKTLARIESMERYVTSSRYDLDRQFAEMEKGSH